MFIFVLTHCRKFRKYKKRKEENKNHPRFYHPDTTLINISGCCPVNHTLRNTCVLYDRSDWGLVFHPFRILLIQRNHFSFMYNLVTWLSAHLQTCAAVPPVYLRVVSAPQEKAISTRSQPLPGPDKLVYFLSLDLPVLDTSHKQNHTTRSFLCPFLSP